ncbi:hypothetical protein EVA_19149 [gut metagenome]|uniref:Uncharacterized protein n=1 Tax=gut metagenome TaxID=749906 RepID=J9FEA2_9ZZZZ
MNFSRLWLHIARSTVSFFLQARFMMVLLPSMTMVRWV